MFGKGVRLFTLFGFPVRADVSWLIVVLLLTWSLANVFPVIYPGLSVAAYWTMGIVGTLGLFASIVIHEFAHALVARHYGLPMRGITLFIFGGVAEMQDEPPSPGVEFRVAIAGPVASVMVGGICILLAGLAAVYAWPQPVAGVFAYVGTMNLVLVVFNLIPAFPLDGGRVLRSILWRRKGSLRRATRITSKIGAGFGIALIVLGVVSIVTGNFVGGMWWVLIGLFLRRAAQMSYQQLVVRRALEGEPVARFMQSQPVTAPPQTTVAELVEQYMYRHNHRLFPVTDDGTLLGFVTTRTVHAVPREEWGSRTVAEVAEPCSDENTVGPDEDAVNALTKMQRQGASRLVVVENDQLRGILTLKDLLRFLSLKMELDDEARPSRYVQAQVEATS